MEWINEQIIKHHEEKISYYTSYIKDVGRIIKHHQNNLNNYKALDISDPQVKVMIDGINIYIKRFKNELFEAKSIKTYYQNQIEQIKKEDKENES